MASPRLLATSLFVTGVLFNPAVGLLNPCAKLFLTSSCTCRGTYNSSVLTWRSSCLLLTSFADGG
eukprot:5699050-Prorocentrum_lima.AAC.1